MYKQTTLSNGIRVITDTMPSVRSISMGVLVDASPRHEPEALSGLAHMVEHLLFQGTINRDAMAIARMMDSAGGHMGAFTSRDYTCFSATVLDDYYTYALELLGDILLNSSYPEDKMVRETEVILREINMGQDNPPSHVHDLLKSITLSHYPYGRPIAGLPETVKNITREDVIYFVNEHYMPNTMIIGAAGSVDHQKFVNHVEDAFWTLMGERGPFQHKPPQIHQERIKIEHSATSQCYFSVGIPALNYTHDDRYAYHLLNNVLGGGISSRLFRRIREERGLVYDIHSEYHAYQDEGLMVIEGSTSPEQLQQVLGLTLMELWKLFLGMEPVDEDEFWKAKMQLRGQHIISSEDTNTRMSRLLTQEYYFGHHISAEEILSQIEKVDNQTFTRMSEESLAPSLQGVKIAVVGPEAESLYSVDKIEAILSDFV